MPEGVELLLKLAGEPRALSDMEKDLQSYLTSLRMHGTIQLNVPPEIYTPLETKFLESEVFHRRDFQITAGDLKLGTVTIWSYRPIDAAAAHTVESYLYPWLLAFRRRLLADVGRENCFGGRMFVSPETDFFKRRLWHEIERGKRYNVFLTYFRVGLKLPRDIHEERVADGIRPIIRAFEPSLFMIDRARLDFVKIGMAAAAAERFVPEIRQAVQRMECDVRELAQLTFPKDFFEYEECLEKISL